jgi:Uma2 family endonuclease
MATDPFYTKLTVDEFLAMDFGDRKVELVDGVIYSMTGGRRSHMRVQGNILSYLRQALRGSDCSAYADFGVKVGDNTAYYPDVSVECGRPDLGLQDDDLLAQRPTVLIEVLSPTTRNHDEKTKLPQYLEIDSVDTVALVDPDAETIRVVQRLGPAAWKNELLATTGDLHLPLPGVTIPRAEIFARD